MPDDTTDDWVRLNVFIPVNEEQAVSLLEAHTSITQGPGEGTGVILPPDFDHFAEMNVGVDLSYGSLDGRPGVWIKDSFGDPNIPYVTKLLQQNMTPDQEPVAFQWASRSIGADTGDYGGGAAVVTPRVIHTITTDGWIDETLEKVGVSDELEADGLSLITEP